MRSMAGGFLPKHTHKDPRHLICEGIKVKGERDRERMRENIQVMKVTEHDCS